MRRPSMTSVLLLALTASLASAQPAPIIGGSTTTVGQFPSVVALSVGGGLCTGTLIDPQWVLTAAHCITPSLLGLQNQQAVTDNLRVHFKTVNLNQSPGTVARASLTIPKTGFSVNNLGQHDIGLIKLAQPVTDIMPTRVNLVAADAPVGLIGTMVGFGATQQGGGGQIGVEFALMNRTSANCQTFGLDNANLLCFAQGDNKGKCQGDSGGPTFAQVKGATMVVGVTSFGDSNCAQFGADTRTDIEMPFLKQHIPNIDRSCLKDTDCMMGKMCFNNGCVAMPFSPGGLGHACLTPMECDSGICAQGPDGMRCTSACMVGATTACPTGLYCLGEAGSTGACWPYPDDDDDTGCCDTGNQGAPTMLLGIGIVALVLRRRRR